MNYQEFLNHVETTEVSEETCLRYSKTLADKLQQIEFYKADGSMTPLGTLAAVVMFGCIAEAMVQQTPAIQYMVEVVEDHLAEISKASIIAMELGLTQEELDALADEAGV